MSRNRKNSDSCSTNLIGYLIFIAIISAIVELIFDFIVKYWIVLLVVFLLSVLIATCIVKIRKKKDFSDSFDLKYEGIYHNYDSDKIYKNYYEHLDVDLDKDSYYIYKSENINDLKKDIPENENILLKNQLYNNFNYDFDKLSGRDFELFCANLLIKLGYKNVSVTSASGDHGIDVFAEKDGVKYAIQCKCYSNNIGNKAVQQAYSGANYYGNYCPVVLTNRFFTNQAITEAKELCVKLWDRTYLLDLIEKINNIEIQNKLYVDKINDKYEKYDNALKTNKYQNLDIYNMNESSFINLCKELLRTLGYENIKIDEERKYNIDILAEKDNSKIAIRCVINPLYLEEKDIWELFSYVCNYYDEYKIIIVTKGFFESNIIKKADELNIELVDIKKLDEIIEKAIITISN